jgi:hypothetical protein
MGDIFMRLLLAAGLVAATVAPVLAANDLPEGVEQLMTCGHVYSMKSDDAAQAGDAGAQAEFFNMSDALLWQARSAMEAAGYTAVQINDVDMNFALTTGFNYGAGMGEQMLADCLAAWDSP